MDVVNRRKRRQEMSILPPTGVLSPDGYPFYHLRRYQLRPSHLQRLDECGIKLKMGCFSKAENEQIKENWMKYAKSNKIDFGRAFEFAGGRSRVISSAERTELLIFQKQTHFVPKMCQGLNDRTSYQVIKRMANLFDPGAERRRRWNAEFEKQFDKLYDEGLTSRDISFRLGLPKMEIDYRISVKRRKEEKPIDGNNALDDGARRTLYDFVMKWLQPSACPLKLEVMLPEKVKWNVADFALVKDQEKAMSYLPWYSLTWKMKRTVPAIKECWLVEVRRLRYACHQCDGDTEKASEMCIPRISQITADQFRRSLLLLLEQKPPSTGKVDVNEFQKRLEEENLIGYCTNGLTEAVFLKTILTFQISNCRKHTVGMPNSESLTYMDWIMILMRYVEGLKADSTQWQYEWKIMKDYVVQTLKKKEGEKISRDSGATTENVGLNISNGDSKPRDEGRMEGNSASCSIPKVHNNHVLECAESEEPSSSNHSSYAVEKLRNLIESRIPLFDEYRQQKYAKKLRKIMNRDEKLERLQRLVEKMVSRLEDEQQRKLSKKYRKIMKKFQKMREAGDGENVVGGGSDGAEALINSDKDVRGRNEMANHVNNREIFSENEFKPGFDADLHVTVSSEQTGTTNLRQNVAGENGTGGMKGRKRKAGSNDGDARSPGILQENEPPRSTNESGYEIVEGVSPTARKKRKIKKEVVTGVDAMRSFLNIVNDVHHRS